MAGVNYEPSFNDAVAFTLVKEGVLSDNANDAGGLTKYGITHTTWDAYRAASGDATLPKSVAQITKDHAIAVYYKNYWLAPKINALPRELQGPAFDFEVNSGGRAIETLQGVLGVDVDGELGPVTLGKMMTMQAGALRRLRNDYVTARGVFLMSLAQNNDNDVAFIKGWFKRVAGLYDFAY